MSIARHHADWLSLVPVSGPFLSLPVLMEAFPQGLDVHDPDHNRLLRQEYARWQQSLDKRKADPAPHHHWIKFVLTKTLDLDEHVLTEGQAIPQTLQVELQEHHELLRPSIVVSDPSTKKPRLLIQTYRHTLSAYGLSMVRKRHRSWQTPRSPSLSPWLSPNTYILWRQVWPMPFQ